MERAFPGHDAPEEVMQQRSELGSSTGGKLHVIPRQAAGRSLLAA